MLVSPDKIDEMYPDVGHDFKELYSAGAEKESSGSLKHGKIIKIDEANNSVMVDISEKNEGRMPLDEIKDGKGNILFKSGDTIPVLIYYQKRVGQRISYKKALKYQRILDEIKSYGADYKGRVVEGVIKRKNKGGFIVESSNGVEYYLPNKEAAFGFKDKDKEDIKYEGRHVKACVIDIKNRQNGDEIQISRRKFLELTHVAQKEGAKKLLETGLAYEGVVKNIAKFGIFVEIGSVEGLVHTSEISYRSVVNPSKLYKVGDKVQVKPLSFDEEKNRLSLSIRALFEDPWKEIKDEIKVGYVICVTVSNIESYGAFVDLGNEIEGFLHISEMSWDKNIKEPSTYLKIGQEINVEVIEIDTENRRLRVSLKKLQDKPFESFIKTHKVGDVVSGKIATITDFGMFVNLGQVDGLLHNEDAFWDKTKKCTNEFKVGDTVEVKIDKIDKENQKISLNMKALTESPLEKFSKKYNLDDIVEGEVIEIKDFGIFVRIKDEVIEALIRNDELGNLKKENINIGDNITGVLAHIDKKTNKVRLSIKRLQKKKERQELNEYNKSEKITLGDALKDKILKGN